MLPPPPTGTRPRGLSVRLRLTLSYAGFLMVAGGLLLAVVWVFLLRYVPTGQIETLIGFAPNRGDLVRAFAPAAAWAMLFLLAFGLAGGWFLAGRMLAPLDRITRATRRAATGSLSHRIDLEGRADEFRELADAFDAMLGRLEAQVAEQQRFAANASHELRTPLAITQTLLDVARSDPERDVDALLTRLRAVNARAIELTEALLLLTRAEQGSFAREPVDLSLVAEEAAETLLPLAEKIGVSIDVEAGAAQTTGSATLLQQLATNLLHNALVHGRVGDGGVVRVSTATGREGVSLVVENAGDPIDPRRIASLVEPFRRGSDRVHVDQAGAGLGLAIVRSIVRAHRGSLTLTPRPAGGLRVTVILPR